MVDFQFKSKQLRREEGFVAIAPYFAFRVIRGSLGSMSIRNRFCWVVTLLTAFVAEKTNAVEMVYIPPVPIAFKEAVYPVNSVATGTVVVIAVVERDGRVSEAKAMKSVVSLDEPSLQAVKQWRFEPARLDGKPIRSKTSISFVYDRGLFPFGKPKN